VLSRSDVEPSPDESEKKLEIFSPYYNKENYGCSDNHSILVGNTLDIKVMILGDSDRITIYPFGKKSIKNDFIEWGYLADISAKENKDILGNIYLNLVTQGDLYVMEVATDYYEPPEGDKIYLSSLDKPFIIKLKCKLE